jgi:hypothetical protein
MKTGTWIIIFSFCFFSCTNRSYIPSGIIKTDQMGDILWDMIRADLLAREIIKKDTTRNLNTETNILTQKILAIHHIDKSKFDKSFQFYSKRPDMMNMIFDSLDARRTRSNLFEIKRMKGLQKNALR